MSKPFRLAGKVPRPLILPLRTLTLQKLYVLDVLSAAKPLLSSVPRL